MKTKNIFLALLVVTFGIFSCADPDEKPILTFEDSTKGGYAKLISESAKLINVLSESTVNASQYTYQVEFVDLQNGGLVTEYKLDLTYEPVTGSDVTVENYLVWAPSDFIDGPNGLKAIAETTITAPQILAALGLTWDQLAPGDNFVFEGFVTLSDGNTYGFDNSSAAVNGSAFGGHFNFTLPASCPTSLEGSYAYSGSNFWCGAADAGGNVDMIHKGGGVYWFSDWSFGAYPNCYGGFIAANNVLTVTDVCAEVSFSGFVDIYGDTWDFAGSSIVGNDWTIEWVNTYGESGTGVVHYTGGADWPITLVP